MEGRKSRGVGRSWIISMSDADWKGWCCSKSVLALTLYFVSRKVQVYHNKLTLHDASFYFTSIITKLSETFILANRFTLHSTTPHYRTVKGLIFNVKCFCFIDFYPQKSQKHTCISISPKSPLGLHAITLVQNAFFTNHVMINAV